MNWICSSLSMVVAASNPVAGPPVTLSVGESGVGPLGASVGADAAALRTMFVGYDVKQTEDYSEGQVVGQALHFSWKGQPVFAVHRAGDKTIYSIEILDKAIKGPGGVHVGSLFANIYGQGKVVCDAGQEEESGHFFCHMVKQPRILFVGTGSSCLPQQPSVCPDGTVPTEQKIRETKIDRIVWRALLNH